MRISLWIAIFLTVFGCVGAALVGTGAYDVAFVDESPGGSFYTADSVTQLVESSSDAEDNPSGGYTGYGINLLSIGSCLIAALTIIPMLTAMGIPLYISLIIQAPIWIIYVMEFYAIRKQVVIA